MTDRIDYFHAARRALQFADEALGGAVSSHFTTEAQEENRRYAQSYLAIALRHTVDMRDAPARDHGEPVVTEDRGPDGEWTTNTDFTGGRP